MRLGSFIRHLIALYKKHYQPEKHYMRGPGPACKSTRSPRSD